VPKVLELVTLKPYSNLLKENKPKEELYKNNKQLFVAACLIKNTNFKSLKTK
jgi:hypothetical protein